MIRSLLFTLIVLGLTATADAQTRLKFVTRVVLNAPEAQYISTGILISRDLVLTNHHAIRGEGKVTVELVNGEVVPAEVVKSTKVQDLALLKIAPVSLPTVAFGSAPQIEQAVRIYGFARGKTYRESSGKVTGAARPANTDRDTMFTTTAGVIQGMSGGPVLNEKMELVGVLFGGNEDDSFCVSIATVQELLETEPKIAIKNRPMQPASDSMER